MSMRESFEVTDRVANDIKPYVQAMMGASGLNEFDATSSVLFAIATHLDLAQYPILAYIGATSTGKSSAMKQLKPLCKGSKLIQGTSPAAHRRELKNVRTAFVDEADRIDSNLELIDLYTRRYLRETAIVQVPERTRTGTWSLKSYNIFGATILAKRASIGDVALRSRAIIIRTRYKLENYEYAQIGDVSRIATSMASNVRRELSEIGGIDRVYQTWSSLIAIAKQLHMADWRTESLEVETQEVQALAGGQGYEPSEAILRAIDILARDDIHHNRVNKSIHISAVVIVVRDEFALNLRHTQIREEAEARGFEISTLHGYPVIKVKKDLLDALLPE